jgi:hypothetical protein
LDTPTRNAASTATDQKTVPLYKSGTAGENTGNPAREKPSLAGKTRVDG